MSDVKLTATPLTPTVCRFHFSENVLGETNSFTCDSAEKAEGSYLLERLFELEGIQKVAINGNELKVLMAFDVDWSTRAKEIGKVLRECLNSEKNLLSPNLFEEAKTSSAPAESDDIEGIRKVLQEQVLPGLASHGGAVDIVDYQEGVLYLSFKGGCQGCSQVNVTVRQGIERLLKTHFPDLKRVEDVTDHAAGENPYFT